MIADRVGDLYFARESRDSALSIQSNQGLQLWHRRFGHLNFKDLTEAVDKNTIYGINLTTSKRKNVACDICVKGKMSRTPFPKTTDRDTKILDIVHSDVCGPMRTESLRKCRYFVEFIDDN